MFSTVFCSSYVIILYTVHFLNHFLLSLKPDFPADISSLHLMYFIHSSDDEHSWIGKPELTESVDNQLRDSFVLKPDNPKRDRQS